MPVAYIYVDDVLGPNGLANPRLNILIGDEHHYTALFYQHMGVLVAVTEGEKFIGNANQDLAAEKHKALFELAAGEQVDLVLTPEYSCPISVLDHCLAENCFPAEGKLWVIGCESLRPAELLEFIDRNAADDTFIIAEKAALESKEDKVLDPVVYFFKTRTVDGGALKNIVLFQFKTYPMGGTDAESENLLLGTERFIMRNDENSIYLATVMCSESLDLDMERDMKQFVDKPYLLLHVQMNSGARTNALRQYRTNFYNRCRKDEEKDLICLNWAMGSKIKKKEIGYSNSAIYSKAEKILLDDSRIVNNDQFGLFYNCWSNAMASILVFDEQEAIYKLENSKASKRRLNVQNQARFGPKMLARLVWNGSWTDEPVPANGSLVTAMGEIGGNFTALANPALTSINKERLLSLSVGEITGGTWSMPIGNRLFAIADNEESFRLMVYQDPATRTAKRIWLVRYSTLATNLLVRPNILPANSHMTDIAEGIAIHYHPDKRNYNVTGQSGVPACIIYLGDADPARAKEIRANLLSSGVSDNNLKYRLMILYTHLGEMAKDYETAAPSAAASRSGKPVAINRKKR
jgi:hypothetical protein